LVVVANDSIIVARDPHGFRPLAIGRMNLSKGPVYVFASETCAFDLIDAHHVGDVEPGEMVIAGPDGLTREFYTLPARPSQCVFEHVYFSRPDSTVFGLPVQQSREMMGRLLAEELPVEADVVVPIPDSGVAAALGYAHASGIPFRHGLIRNHYVGRTFIEPSQAIRDFGVRLKLNPVRDILAGKSVILVDDSLVRGTTSQKIVRMVRNAGAREVHLRISCPPTISPCFYGVDTPTKRELIAANQSVEEIRQFIDCDTLAYLSLDKLQLAVHDIGAESHFCYACYTGDYPTDLVNIEELMTSRPNRC
jgi:amidophosphoribosyltransferase